MANHKRRENVKKKGIWRMKRWNLYSKAESITVSIGGNVHGVIPYLEDKQWIRKT